MLAELGVRMGHWTDGAARTGCTVLLLPEGATGSAEVRGGAPASRELELLAPERTVAQVDAIVLTGGSAFGLASADGVMRYCEESGRGVATPAGRVPIVPALGLFDLAVGDASVRPGAAEGYAACVAAAEATAGSGDGGVDVIGAVGAGAGATVGKINGPNGMRPGGLVANARRAGELLVACVVAVNAFGEIDVDGSAALRLARRHGEPRPGPLFDESEGGAGLGNTTIGAVVTNARLDKVGCLLVCQGAHDGLSRAIVPPHTRFDGDAFIAAATGMVEADVDTVRLLALTVVDEAIRSLG
ncbi:P1 family peptidase [Stackebrandtia nassauensis]|uniref:Peptidase S58 DmpA n=1 Tax=Stackebrandtia nassauensis (strain DSM 44728 / CIP 108903 / NRRL B-16338 / NBRC 102104 / LLR-40K-21) TaxID=446470 RepID=D3PVA9_STANL|nr:P1 family peptidase [Stackebrandtia nassauensis]ADD41162.1 peptidase S58 DmpA [Stackebrandtia nassauensis DSM 44728]